MDRTAAATLMDEIKARRTPRQASHSRPGSTLSVMQPDGLGRGICPACSRAGLGREPTPGSSRLTELADLLVYADELTDPRRHVEVITGSFWDRNRNKKTRTVRRVTTLPSLLAQLADAVIPGETYVEAEGSKPGFGSRPPARLDAIDRLLAIDAGAARWMTSIGLQPRDTTAGNIRALVGVSGTLDSDTLSALVYEVSLWRTWAATVTGWQSPPWRPRVPCPVCDRLGSLRIRLDRSTACCMDCGEAWSEADGRIYLLAEHIRAEGEKVPA